MPRTLRLGSSFAFNGAALVKGSPPAKCTAGSVVAGQGKLIGRWTLPADPQISSIAGFFKAVGLDDDVEFPVDASPDEVLGKVSKWPVEGLAVGQLYDLWVVTRDKYGTPLAPTTANALYLGRGRVSSTRQSNIGGAVFL